MHTQETIKVVPARYPLRAVGALLALLVLAVAIRFGISLIIPPSNTFSMAVMGAGGAI